MDRYQKFATAEKIAGKHDVDFKVFLLFFFMCFLLLLGTGNCSSKTISGGTGQCES